MRDGRAGGKTSALMPEGATQVEKTHARWSWVEPSVWTERMLTALEHRVRGYDWLSLALAKRVLYGAGVFSIPKPMPPAVSPLDGNL